MTHTLITGGAGFIGSHLAEALLARGDQVTIIDDLSTGRFENIELLAGKPGFRFALETITNETVMDRLGSECDRILHLAAAVGVQLIVTDPVRTIETNVMGTEAVLRVARRYRKKVFLASTSEVYGKNEKVPFREEDDGVYGATTITRWAYATSKALDEFLALAYGRSQSFRLSSAGSSIPSVRARARNTAWSSRASCARPCGRTDHRLRRRPADPLLLQRARRGCGGAAAVGASRRGRPGVQHRLAGGNRHARAGGDGQGARKSPRTIRAVPYEQAYDGGYEDMRRRVPDTQKIQRATGWSPKIPLRKRWTKSSPTIKPAGR